MQDNTLYIPNILAYTFVALFVVLVGFVITATTQKIYRLLNRKKAKETIESLIEPTAVKTCSQAQLSKSRLNLKQPENQLIQLRKSKLG